MKICTRPHCTRPAIGIVAPLHYVCESHAIELIRTLQLKIQIRDPYVDPQPGDRLCASHGEGVVVREVVEREPDRVRYRPGADHAALSPRWIKLTTWTNWCRNRNASLIGREGQ